MRPDSQAIGNSNAENRLLDLDRLLLAANDENVHPFACLKDVIEGKLQHGHCEIHLEQETEFCRIRCRVNGRLDEQKIPTRSMLRDLTQQLLTESGQSRASQTASGELITGLTIGKRLCRLEASYYPTQNGSNLTLGISSIEALPETLDQLDLPANTIDSIRQHYQSKARGITLICGADTHQLQMLYYALLGETNTVEDKVISMERFISKPFARISQISIDDTAENIANLASRNADRVFIDCTGMSQIGLVNELISNRHPASLLLCAANSADAIRQLLDAGVDEHALASALSAIVEIGSSSAICPHCADSHILTSREQIWLDTHSIINTPTASDVFVQANGCVKCEYTGRDRLMVFASLIKRTDAIATAVVSRSTQTIKSVLQHSLGKHSVRYQIESAVRTGQSSFSEFIKS